MCILTAQARANCASRSWAPYFDGKFWHETADVNVNFDLRKLAQNGCPVPGARHFMTSSWDSLWGPGVKLSKFLVTQACGDPSGMLSEAFAWSCTGPCEKLLRGPGEILSVSLHDLVSYILVGRSCEDFVEILLTRSLRYDLEDALRWCMYEIYSGVLIGSSCVKIFWDPPYRST